MVGYFILIKIIYQWILFLHHDIMWPIVLMKRSEAKFKADMDLFFPKEYAANITELGLRLAFVV